MYYDNTKDSNQVLSLVLERDAHSAQALEAIPFLHTGGAGVGGKHSHRK